MALVVSPLAAFGQSFYEEEPINYGTAPVDDPVSRLQARIDSGAVSLRHDERFGYLPAVLGELGVSTTSQGLVFSKTSFQLRRISPRTPRAVYFGDDVYVGFVQGGDVIEVSSVDPHLGGIFYTLSQRPAERPRFTRHIHECTSCHGSTLTSGIPGHVVRSVFSAPDGQPVLRAGTFRSDQSSPLEERWGGWYVTGTHGTQRHMGNNVFTGEEPEELERDRGANVTDLRPFIDTTAYLSPHSDIVALMVLEHQTQMHNLITKAAFQTRRALWDQKVLDEALERTSGELSDSTRRRIENAARPLLEYMLHTDALRLADPIRGTSSFAEEFAKRGPRDAQGRSLRDLDLTSRVFKYPLSYLVYSEAFAAMPPVLAEHVWRRLYDVLTGEDVTAPFDRLAAADRTAVLEILRGTKPDLPTYWRDATTPAEAGQKGESATGAKTADL